MTCSIGSASKLVNRHPHVFGDVKADTSAEVVRNWEALKAEEKRKEADEKLWQRKRRPTSVLAGISSKVPALLEAHKTKLARREVGFDWPTIDGLFDKLHEEID